MSFAKNGGLGNARTGTLEVTLKSVMFRLKVRESTSHQAPYCVISCANVNQRSKTDPDGGLSPVWNQAFTFINTSSEMLLKLEFFDENTLLRDVAIGGCKVSLHQVAASGSEEVRVPVVSRKGKFRGDLFIDLRFTVNIVSKGTMGAKGGASWILPTYANTDCWKDYEPGILLGQGTFGTTYLATKKGTNQEFAVKIIAKRKLGTPEEIEDVRREVQIMHHLEGHPNVVCLKDVYEDKANVCLVMELCQGGELFDNIVKRGKYTEKDAASLIRVIVSVVLHCHNMGVIHRDLKPENFLLQEKNTANSPIKATDFGLSSFFQEGQVFTDIVGSAYYVAPEVLRRSYSKEADIWSCGVILYILLCGYPPFVGDNEKKIFEAVISKNLDFNAEPWPSVSAPAKDCVKRMLVRDPKLRANAQEILMHDWMKENGVAGENVIHIEVLSRIQKFSAMNKLKKEALKVIAINLPLDEISGMREIFLDIDQDGSGEITVEEFAAALKKKGATLNDEEVKRLLMEADVDGDGTIDYEEFLAATIHLGKLDREENLRSAFKHFDIDGDGQISLEELVESLEKLGMPVEEIQEIIRVVDQDQNGSIDYDEFCAMMRDNPT